MIEMADYDLSTHTNPDARAWAKFFMERCSGCAIGSVQFIYLKREIRRGEPS